MQTACARHRSLLLAAGLSLSLAGLAAGPVPDTRASAGPLHVALRVSANSEGDVNRIDVTVTSTPGAVCSLHVTAGKVVKGFSGRPTGPAGRIAWHWDSPSPSSQRPWRFLSRCTSGQFYAWRFTNVEFGFPSRRGALDVSTAGGRSCDTQGVCFADGPFPIGQCGWYAQGRRPDLLGKVRGNAGGWLEEVKGAVPEGSIPVVGALAVWLPYVNHAGAEGHVGYVAAVSGARVLIDDSNWTPTPTSNGLEVHEHWVPADAPSGYIYGGPAGNGP